MYEYLESDTDLGLVSDDGRTDGSRPDDVAVLLDVAARFASEHGVPAREGRRTDREERLRRAARSWPTSESTAAGEAYELLSDAVQARDRFPRLWAAATDVGALRGSDLRQLVRQHRNKSWADCARIDADQAAVLRTNPELWHAVFRASRFLGQLHDLGLTDDQILEVLDEHVLDAELGSLAS